MSTICTSFIFLSVITNSIANPLPVSHYSIDTNAPLGNYIVTNSYVNGEKTTVGKAAFNEPILDAATSSDTPPLSENQTEFDVDNYIMFLLGDVDGDRNRVWNPYDSWDEVDTWDTDLGHYPEATVGDFDGDGADETLVAGGTGYDAAIWDDKTANFATLHTFSVLDEENEVASANIDGDYSSEILILGKNSADVVILVCDDASTNFAELAQIAIIPPAEFTTDPTLSSGRITSGDVDGDNKDEIIVLIYETSYSYKCVLVYDDAENDFSLIGSKSFYYYYLYDIIAADLDADGLDEIIVHFAEYLQIYSIITGSFSLLDDIEMANTYSDIDYLRFAVGNFDDVEGLDIAVCLYRINDFLCFFYGYSSSGIVLINFLSIDDEGQTPYSNICVSNFDEDSYDEIAITYLLYSYLTVAVVLDDYTEDFAELCYRDYDPPSTTVIYPTVVAGDFTGKIVIQYVHHNTSTSNPQVIAAIAAPPTISGIKQVYDFSGTVFGTAVSGSSGTSNGYSVKTGICFSFEKDDIIGIFGVKVSAQFDDEFERTFTLTETETQCVEYVVSSSSDSVIFQIVPYNNYYYQFICHPNSTHVGEWMAISVPSTPIVYKWSKSLYNEEYANFAIGTETFNHTVGQPATYLTEQNKQTLMVQYLSTGFWDSDKMTVGAGDATNAVGISLAIETTTEVTRTISTEFEAGVSIFGFGLAVSYGYSTSSAYTITVEDETSYQGIVGDIDERYYQLYNYSFGLLVYNFENEKTNLNYQVINYWVDDYNGPLVGKLFLVDSWWFWTSTGGGVVVISLAAGATIFGIKKKSSKKNVPKPKTSKKATPQQTKKTSSSKPMKKPEGKKVKK